MGGAVVVLSAAVEDADHRRESRECYSDFREGLEQFLVFQLIPLRGSATG